uniref:Uncharacterized protein n=1 Tax=Aegilops tauschii subsp. strangulata TaxID=200361 RepID=A0A453CQC7_AEGTS
SIHCFSNQNKQKNSRLYCFAVRGRLHVPVAVVYMPASRSRSTSTHVPLRARLDLLPHCPGPRRSPALLLRVRSGRARLSQSTTAPGRQAEPGSNGAEEPAPPWRRALAAAARGGRPCSADRSRR